MKIAKTMCLAMVSFEASEYWASLCGLIALIQPIPASVSLSETKKYSAHHATNTLAYAIQKFIPESKGETFKRLHRENCVELFRVVEIGRASCRERGWWVCG